MAINITEYLKEKILNGVADLQKINGKYYAKGDLVIDLDEGTIEFLDSAAKAIAAAPPDPGLRNAGTVTFEGLEVLIQIKIDDEDLEESLGDVIQCVREITRRFW